MNSRDNKYQIIGCGDDFGRQSVLAAFYAVVNKVENYEAAFKMFEDEQVRAVLDDDDFELWQREKSRMR